MTPPMGDLLAVGYRKLGFSDWHRQGQFDAGERRTRVRKCCAVARGRDTRCGAKPRDMRRADAGKLV